MTKNCFKAIAITVFLGPVLARCATLPGYTLSLTESDLPKIAAHQDARLINPWGIVDMGEELIIADNGTGVLTFYSPGGTRLPGSVIVPPPRGGTNTAAPSGIVLNSAKTFMIAHGARQAPARLLIATEDGTVSAWDNSSKGVATLMIDNSATGSVYKGVAIAGPTNAPLLYLTDFHNGFVAVYNSDFDFVKTFTDPALTNIGYAPFGIRMIQDKLVVTFAKQDSAAHDDVAGPGNGYIDIFNTNGILARQFATNGTLNSPWSLAVAPKQFGTFSYALLVGNFGDGNINAYNLLTGEYLGALKDGTGATISLSGLWGLTFNVDPTPDELEYIATKLFVTAGLNAEADGALGNIKAISPLFPPVH